MEPEKVSGSTGVVLGLELDGLFRQLVLDHRLDVVVVSTDVGFRTILSQNIELGLKV